MRDRSDDPSHHEQTLDITYSYTSCGALAGTRNNSSMDPPWEIDLTTHRQYEQMLDRTYHSLCYTGCGTLTQTRNSSMDPPWGIDLTTYHTMRRCWIEHTTAFVTLVVEHWLELEIAQWIHLQGSIWWPIAPRADSLQWRYGLFKKSVKETFLRYLLI